MAGPPDLFVVCKNCRAEVSPYITECPYCGHRLRKRAPKLDKVPRSAKSRPRPSVPRPRTPDVSRLRGTTKPVVALTLVLVPVLLVLAGRAGVYDVAEILMLAGLGGEPWRAGTTLVYYLNTAHEVVTLGAVFLFAWLLERRHGWWAPLLVFLIGGVAGNALALAADSTALSVGGHGAALALLAAWAMRDVLEARRGEDIDSDLLGVLVIAVVLVLMPAAVEEAHALAGVGGLIAGALLGLPFARLPER